MKLYLLVRPNKTNFIVRAQSEKKARNIAHEKVSFYGEKEAIWKNQDKTLCIEIPTEGTEGILFRNIKELKNAVD